MPQEEEIVIRSSKVIGIHPLGKDCPPQQNNPFWLFVEAAITAYNYVLKRLLEVG